MRGVALVLFASACSLGRVGQESCTDSDQCKVAFGWDSVCGGEGYCEPMEAPDRCQTTFPEDLWENRRDYDDTVIVAGLYNLGYVEDIKSLELPLRLLPDFIFDGHRLGTIICDHADFDADHVESAYADRLFHTEAVTYYSKWISQELGIHYIVGLEDSESAELAIQANQQVNEEVLIVSPSATSPSLANYDGDPSAENPGLFWRTAPSDAYQGQALAAYATEIAGVRNVGILYVDNAYGQGLSGVFYDTFTAAGGSARTYQVTEDNISAQVSAAVAANHDAVVLISGGDLVVPFFESAALQPEFLDRGIKILLTDAAKDDAVTSNASTYSALFPLVAGTFPSNLKPTGTYGKFIQSYSDVYKEDLDPDAAAYSKYVFDASFMMLSGIIWSYYNDGGITPHGIGTGLRNISDGEKSNFNQSDWRSILVEKFKVGKSVDVEGASGQLNYDPATGETSGAIEVWRIEASGDPPTYSFVPDLIYTEAGFEPYTE